MRIERGYVRPEDELPVEPEPALEPTAGADGVQPPVMPARVEGDGEAVQGPPEVPAEPEEDEDVSPIPDRLMTELTAHRTLALRQALGEHPDVAFLAALHALCLKVFYRYALDSCLELDLKSVSFGTQAPGLNDSASAQALGERHHAWTAALPKEPAELWDALQGFDHDSRQALFAHCVGLSVNAVHESWNRRPRALAHADRLAQVLDLDMVAAGWTPTVDTYLGRVTKGRIVQAVREAKGERAAQLIEPLKKGDMADKAQALLAGSGWLPEPLRTPGRPVGSSAESAADEPEAGPEAPGNMPTVEDEDPAEAEPVVIEPHAIAAE